MSEKCQGEHDLERDHYMEVRYALLEYSAYMEQDLQRIRERLNKLPPDVANLLSVTTTNRY